jgi:hypothetical protein
MTLTMDSCKADVSSASRVLINATVRLGGPGRCRGRWWWWWRQRQHNERRQMRFEESPTLEMLATDKSYQRPKRLKNISNDIPEPSTRHNEAAQRRNELPNVEFEGKRIR